MTCITTKVCIVIHLELDEGIQCGLGSITMNKVRGGEGISDELFQILKDDTIKILHSICH